MSERPVYSHPFDLMTLGETEKEFVLAPKGEDRAAIAAWAGIESLDSFTATVRVRRKAPDHFSYAAEFSATVTQACVVTLEPVVATLEGGVEREFRIAPKRLRHAPHETPVATGDDEAVETLTTGSLDLAAPVLEEFVLSLDPYPRAPGAAFEAPEDGGDTAKPFAELARLKEKR